MRERFHGEDFSSRTRMDKELLRATDYIDSSPSCPEQSGAQAVLQEMKAQLYTHLATLLIKMAAMVRHNIKTTRVFHTKTISVFWGIWGKNGQV